MSRPLRIEFPGALYHVTSRGNRREAIFDDDVDRRIMLDVVACASVRFDARVIAYCLMCNHYHFVLHTRRANLSVLMRHINGVYTQAYNRRHGKVGHLFQGRFKAILVDRQAYLLAVCRYVELNPVAAHLVVHAGDWPWSSYLANSGKTIVPAWLDTSQLYGQLLGRDVCDAADHREAAVRYDELVIGAPLVVLWPGALRQQIYLGDEDFVGRMQALAAPLLSMSAEVPRIQRLPQRTLRQWLDACSSRDEALWSAHSVSGMKVTTIAREIGLSVSRVSRLISQAERIRRGAAP